MDTIGDRVVTAYGAHPESITVRGVPMVGEFGVIVKVGSDGWHDVRLDSGDTILLNAERYRRV
jgi:hypothetical protein